MDNIIYTLNYTCLRLNLHMTLFKDYSKTKSLLAHIRPFDCKVYTHVSHCLYKKLNPKNYTRFFFNYFDNFKEYWI